MFSECQLEICSNDKNSSPVLVRPSVISNLPNSYLQNPKRTLYFSNYGILCSSQLREKGRGKEKQSILNLMVWSKEALSSWPLSLQKLRQVTPLLWARSNLRRHCPLWILHTWGHKSHPQIPEQVLVNQMSNNKSNICAYSTHGDCICYCWVTDPYLQWHRYYDEDPESKKSKRKN